LDLDLVFERVLEFDFERSLPSRLEARIPKVKKRSRSVEWRRLYVDGG